MRFEHKKGVTYKKGKRRFWNVFFLVLCIAGIAAGLYILLLVATPNISAFYPVKQIDAKTLSAPTGDRVYIPKIGVSVPIATGEVALNDGAWHRYPERGDPLRGGNFILAAHRFEIGLTPGETARKSPFYHIDKLNIGDQVLVDFKGRRYAYQVVSHSDVKPDQIEVEAPSAEPKLTLYSCTLKGQSDGREVFVAKPLGVVVDGGIEPDIRS